MNFLRLKPPRLILVFFGVFFGLLILSVGLSACGGGTGTSSDNNGENGELVVSLTDAEGDFSSYTVDVISLTLTKANGAEVSVLPMSARIDFAQYTDMTEFLTAATVPSGVYVAASMTLDYSNAEIWVENGSGELVQAENIVDEGGAPITLLEVTVQLEGRNHLLIAPGIPMHLALDFDLAATNSVTFDNQGAATVAVDPYLIADVNRVNDKIHRLRGLLDEVDPAESTFTVMIRPFYCPMTGNHRRFGRMTVSTGSDTLFELNGTAYQGEEGLEAMQDLDPLTAVVAVGDLRFNPLRFEAEEVYAGTSVPWGDQDIATGSVVAREGDTLTVKGATLVRSDGSVIFHDLVTVTLGDPTRVTRQFSKESYQIGDISVGQRVTVFGTLTNDDPLDLVLDATEGQVRLHLTTVRGSVLSTDSADPVSQLNLALQSINHHRVGIFDFSGTGVDSENDADPDNYNVNTGALDISGLGTGAPVKVRGFVQPFGAAPQDFNAWTIISVEDVKAFLKVQWDPESAEAFESVTADGLTLNLDGVGHPHHVFRAWVLTDLTDLAQSPVVTPVEDGNGLYILHYALWTDGEMPRPDGPVEVFSNFKDFSDSLNSRLADGWLVQKIWARGDFDDAAATLSADLVDIHLK